MLMESANDTKLEGVAKNNKDRGLIQRSLKVGGKPVVPPPLLPPKKQIKTYKNTHWKKFNLRKI